MRHLPDDYWERESRARMRIAYIATTIVLLALIAALVCFFLAGRAAERHGL